MDPTQVELLKKDKCILVDQQDEIIGYASKEQCHTRKLINQNKMLHRAFSVLLFDTQDRLLLQRRSAHKITFPSCWTNTCCSHPLYQSDQCEKDELSSGKSEEELLQIKIDGVKRAALARVDYEMGISDLSMEDLHCLTRILYRAPVDDIWSEYEIDYVLIARKDVPMNPNENEVGEAEYFDRERLFALLDSAHIAGQPLPAGKKESDVTTVSPWFRIMSQEFLNQWWDDLDNITRGVEFDPTIHSFMEKFKHM